MDEIDEAIDTIASSIVANLELPGWEHYPEIGKHDWERVERACRTKLMVAGGFVNAGKFREAYSLLEGRATPNAD